MTTSLTDAQRRERWCDSRTKRAEDITPYDVIRRNGRWTEVFGVYRDMDEWEAEFGAIGGITGPDIGSRQPNPEYEAAKEALDWGTPTWVLLRLFDLEAANPVENPDFTVKVYKFDLIEVQTRPAWEPSMTDRREHGPNFRTAGKCHHQAGD
jgi:hypothetical protein